MTFCFAARCKDGIIIAGDRLVSDDNGPASFEQTKVLAVDKNTVIAFAGTRYAGRLFLERMLEKGQDKPQDLSKWIPQAENVLEKIWDKYGQATGNDELDEARHEDDCKLETLVIGTDKEENGKAQIYFIATKLMPENEDGTAFIGEGANTGRGALAVLWNESLKLNRAWPLAAAIMKVVSSMHTSVGGVPDIYLVKDGGGQCKVDADKVKNIYENSGTSLGEIPGFLLSKLKSMD